MWTVRLREEHIQAMIDHALADAPHEACGILVGDSETIERVIPIVNAAETPTTDYQLSPEAMAGVLAQSDTEGLAWIGVYHSHPTSEPVPSAKDIREATAHTPTLVHIIVSLRQQNARLQAWHIQNGEVNPVEILVSKQRSKLAAPMRHTQIWAVIAATFISVILLLAVSFSLLPPAPPIPTP